MVNLHMAKSQDIVIVVDLGVPQEVILKSEDVSMRVEKLLKGPKGASIGLGKITICSWHYAQAHVQFIQ